MNYISITADGMRAATLFVVFYVFFAATKAPVLGAFIAITVVLSFALKFRRRILIAPSRFADFLELGAVFLIFANALVLAFGKYEDPTLSYLDIMLHFFGGAVAGWWTLLAFYQKLQRNIGRISLFILLLSVVTLIGVGWEFFEWVADHTIGIWFMLPPAQPSVNDVLSDILMDIAGGIVVLCILIKSRVGGFGNFS